jgi:hypothetical protein
MLLFHTLPTGVAHARRGDRFTHAVRGACVIRSPRFTGIVKPLSDAPPVVAFNASRPRQ